MLVVIEGCDRAGKTTLARAISRQTGAQYMHFSAPRSHPLEEYIDPVLHYEPGAGRHIVMDRGYLGEDVWPTVFGRYSLMTPEVRKIIEGALMRRRALLVLCTRPLHELVAAAAADGEPVDAKQVELARDLFELSYLASPLEKVLLQDAVAPGGASDITQLAELVEREGSL